MKSISIALVAALLAVAGGATAIALAAPAASETSADPCISGPKDVVPCALWAVECVGDALGGNACHGIEAAASAESPVVDCVKTAVRNILDGVTPEPCTVNAAASTESPVVDCVKRAVRDLLNGVTPMPCPIAAQTATGPNGVVDCVVYVVGQIVSNRPILPCDISQTAHAEADGGVVDYALCMANGAYRTLKGQPAGFCYLPAEAASADGPKEIIECAKKNVHDILQGTPQPCAA